MHHARFPGVHPDQGEQRGSSFMDALEEVFEELLHANGVVLLIVALPQAVVFAVVYVSGPIRFLEVKRVRFRGQNLRKSFLARRVFGPMIPLKISKYPRRPSPHSKRRLP